MSAFLFSRVSCVIVLACAAVVSFIIGPHAAKAFPNIPPSDGGMEPSLRSYKRFGLLSSEPGIVTGTRTETAQSWKAIDGDAPSVIYFQPNLLRKGPLNYNPHSRHNQPQFQGMSQFQGGQNVGEVTSRMNPNPFFQSQNGGASEFVVPHNGNSQTWLSPILRKSSQQQRLRPQSASQVQKSYDYEHIPRSGTSTLPESRSKDRIYWQSPNFPESSRSREFWSSQRNSKVLNPDNKEVHAGTSRVQSNKPPSFVNQKSSFLRTASTSIHSSVNKPEKLTSSITTQLSQGEFPQNSNGKTSYKRVQSYLLRNSHTTEAPKGVNNQNSQHNVHRGQVFIQQIGANLQNANSMLIHNENTLDGKSSVIYRAPKQDTLTPHEDTNRAKTNVNDGRSGLPDTGRAMKPYESVQPKESYMHPYRFQKYSFGQRVAGQEKTTTPKSSPLQEYGPANNMKIKNKSGVGSVEQKADGKKNIKVVTLTRIKPQSKLVEDGTTLTPFNRQYKQGKNMECKAVTYDDIIGSASFSSITPAKMVTDHFEKSKTTSLRKETVPQNQTVDLADVMHEIGKANGSHRNTTEDNSAVGEKLDFRKEEAETELGISDLGVSEKESEAKGVPEGLLSDLDDNIERDSLLEMDYLRTSTGNVSFQSLNLTI